MEILSSIISYLDQKTLKTAASSVCRQWRSVAIGHILRYLHVRHDNKKFSRNLQSRLLSCNVLEVGQNIMRLSWSLSAKDAVYWEDMLDGLIQALQQIQSNAGSDNRRSRAYDSRHPPSYGSNKSQLRIKILTLNLQVPDKLDQLLSLVAPSNLRELTIDFEFSSNPVHLGTVLDMCSNLLHLTLSSHKVVPIRDHVLARSEAWLHPDSRYEGHRPHPLRSLHIAHMCFLPGNLQSYFARLGSLKELHCLEDRSRRSDTTQVSFHDNDTRRIFWVTLARDCPLLESLHFPMDLYSGYVVPVELFPRVHDYCVDYRDVTAVGLLGGILANRVESRLTTLEIIKSKIGRYQSRDPHFVADRPDDLMYRILCLAPQLVHLKTGPYPMWSTVLWGKGDQTGIWACRRLKTLSLALEPDLLQYRGSKTDSRHIFAYISRCCPELEELRIEVSSVGLLLASGLCLLTRLRNLQSLTLKGDFLSAGPPNRRELAWIQTKSSLKARRTSTSSSWLSRFLQSSVKDALSIMEAAHVHCINMVQSLSDSSPNTKANTNARLRMQQQQQDNQFSSDYKDRAFPMADGLVDMEFSGSYLDIEACLRAQLFRLRRLRHLQTLSSNGSRVDVSTKELEEAAKAAEVWPHMKRIRLIHHFSTSNRGVINLREARERVEKASQFLYELRPDIYVLLHE